MRAFDRKNRKINSTGYADRVSLGKSARRVLAFLAVFAVIAVPGWARSGESPVSLRASVIPQEAVERLQMQAIDVQSLLEEDRLTDLAFTPGPTRFAAPFEVQYDPVNSGTWEDLVDGSRLWRLRIASPGALSLNLGFSRFDLPVGAELWIYDATGQRTEGPYTWRDQAQNGELWSPILLGDEIVIELYMPPGADDPRLEIGAVNHGYRFFGEQRSLVEKQGDCNIDVICPEVDSYRDQVRAVARYTLSGTRVCTGNLVNNTSGDFRPLFLTADHCGINGNNASSVVVYWNYESPNCGDLDGGSLADNQSGATFLANHSPTDFALIELNQMPDEASNVFYAGWDAGGETPQGVVGIHHPRGDEKAAAFEGDALVSVDIGNGTETHWQVTAWDLGTTEPGSSGSCIFDQTSKACVGHLTGGLAACDNPGGFDVYGKLSEAWTGADTDSTRLSNWLDPINGGATTSLAGANPTGGGDDDDDDDDDGGGDDDDDGNCTANSRTMCLNGNRFQADISWRDQLGNNGSGNVYPIGEDYWGIFWFFTRMNGEILVKVLDGCEYNGHFWVFASGATDVEYTLTVTDTTTGDAQTYSNDLGLPAEAVLDVSAFATCP